MRDLRITLRLMGYGESGELTHSLLVDGMLLERARDPEAMVMEQVRQALRKLRRLEEESRGWSEEEWDARARGVWLGEESSGSRA